MISLIVYPNGLRFINVYIYCKPPYQPKYQYLRKVLEPLKEIGYFEYTDDKNIVAMDVIKPNSLIIFDDVATCRQDIIRQYFSLGRHRSIFSSTSRLVKLILQNSQISRTFLENTLYDHFYLLYHLFLTAAIEPPTAEKPSGSSTSVIPTAVIEPPTAEEPPGSSAVMEPSTAAEESSGSFASVMEPLTTAEERWDPPMKITPGEPPRKRPKLQDLDASGVFRLRICRYFPILKAKHLKDVVRYIECKI
nr:unnamed protein product [Callosobruchus analis]